MLPQKSSTPSNWRTQPGFLREGETSYESVQILMGSFLADKYSPSLLPEKDLFAEGEGFEWGEKPPLEKVITSPEVWQFFIRYPQLLKQAITIVEPWRHVGKNELDEEVQASKNVAFVVQKIADCDSILLPIWLTGFDPKHLESLVSIITSSMAIVLEGGGASVFRPKEWEESNCSLEQMLELVEKILLSRSPHSAPVIAICVSHQLMAKCHILVLQKATESVLNMDIDQFLSTMTLKGFTREEIEAEKQAKEALYKLQETSRKIRSIGENIEFKKEVKIKDEVGNLNSQEIIIKGWRDEQFPVSHNEGAEIGECQLIPYKTPPRKTSTIPSELLDFYQIMADELEGIIDKMILQYENDIGISMFHTEEVNQEAIIFANWAYMTLHDAIVPDRKIVAQTPLSWLLRLPYSVKILASTEKSNGEILTECSCTCISYKDFESKKIRRSFTLQFHPELLDDLRAFGKDRNPAYAELKQSDGIRLLIRLLYEAIQE